MCRGYLFTAQMRDRDTPVLPPVYSTIVPFALRRPSASAASIMASAIRSFMLPVGFSLSSFSRMRAPFLGTILRKANKEVLPMQCRMSGGNSFMLLVPFLMPADQSSYKESLCNLVTLLTFVTQDLMRQPTQLDSINRRR